MRRYQAEGHCRQRRLLLTTTALSGLLGACGTPFPARGDIFEPHQIIECCAPPNLLFVNLYFDPSNPLDVGESVSVLYNTAFGGAGGWFTDTTPFVDGPASFAQLTYDYTQTNYPPFEAWSYYQGWLDNGYSFSVTTQGGNGAVVDDGVAGYTDSQGNVYSAWPSFPSGGFAGPSNSQSQSTHCFRRGTLILTPEGELPIELLNPGDFVSLYSGGRRRIKGITRDFTYEPLVCFRPHSLDINLLTPRRALYVTKAHEIYFPEADAFVLARDLVNGNTIEEVYLGPVEVFHLDLGSHEVIVAEGAPLESLARPARPLASSNDDCAPGYEHYAPVHCKGSGRRYRLKRWLLAPFYPEAPEHTIRQSLSWEADHDQSNLIHQ